MKLLQPYWYDMISSPAMTKFSTEDLEVLKMIFGLGVLAALDIFTTQTTPDKISAIAHQLHKEVKGIIE